MPSTIWIYASNKKLLPSHAWTTGGTFFHNPCGTLTDSEPKNPADSRAEDDPASMSPNRLYTPNVTCTISSNNMMVENSA